METNNLFNDTKNGGSYQSWELATIGGPKYHIQNFYSYDIQTKKPVLQAQQSKDQVGFRSFVGVGDTFAVFENVCSKSMEWSVPIWCASLDLRKTFGRIEYNALFGALKVQGVPHAYLKLINTLILS